MAFLDWDESFSVHVPEFDAAHQELIRLLNEAHHNFVTKASPEATRMVLDQLLDYAQSHFSAEESWMQTHHYPQLEQHVAEHDDFYRKMFDLKKEFDSGSTRLSFEVLNFLKDWLYEHILTTDKDYSELALRLRE